MQSQGTLENHPVYEVLGSANAAVLEALKLDNLTEGVAAILRKAVAATAFARTRVKNADLDLLPDGPLQTIQSSAQEVADNASQYASTRNDAQLIVVRQASDRILVALTHFLSPNSPEEVSALVNTANVLASNLDNAVAKSRAAIEEIARSSQETGQLVAQTGKEAKARFDQATSDTLQKVETLATQISEERQRLLTLTTEYQNQFAAAQEQRAKDFNDARTKEQERSTLAFDELQKRLNALGTELDKEARARTAAFEKDQDSLRADHVKRATDLLSAMMKSKEQVEKLVGVIGNLGVTSGYLRQANVARRVMWFWQLLALGALACLVWIAVKAFLPAAEGMTTFTWQVFASRASIAVAIGLLAAYAATQGERAANQERRNRRLALELEAIGPFLAAMSPEDQQKFRFQMGEKSFGVDPDAHTTSKEASATIVGHLLKSKEFRQLLETVIKASKP